MCRWRCQPLRRRPVLHPLCAAVANWRSLVAISLLPSLSHPPTPRLSPPGVLSPGRRAATVGRSPTDQAPTRRAARSAATSFQLSGSQVSSKCPTDRPTLRTVRAPGKAQNYSDGTLSTRSVHVKTVLRYVRRVDLFRETRNGLIARRPETKPRRTFELSTSEDFEMP